MKSWKEENTLLKEGHWEVLSDGLDKPITEWRFVLNSNRKHIDCDSYEELKDNLDYYGLPARMAIFDKNKYRKNEGYIQNDYQNWSALAYPPTEYGSWVE